MTTATEPMRLTGKGCEFCNEPCNNPTDRNGPWTCPYCKTQWQFGKAAAPATFATVKVSHEITEQRVKDLMCSAWEGGSNYWCSLKATRLTPAADALRSDIKAARLASEGHSDFYRWEIPFLPGGVLELLADEEKDDEGQPLTLTLDREDLIAGLQVMAEKYPRQFHDFLIENDDAETGDTFLQCCLFGEAIYG